MKLSRPDDSQVPGNMEPQPEPGEPDGESPVDPEPDAGSMVVDPLPTDDAGVMLEDASVVEPEEDAGYVAGTPKAAWYTCQNSDQQFVRNAFLAVLGRRPFSQAEVNVYTDLIAQIDATDGISDPTNPQGSKLRRSRKVVLQTL